MQAARRPQASPACHGAVPRVTPMLGQHSHAASNVIALLATQDGNWGGRTAGPPRQGWENPYFCLRLWGGMLQPGSGPSQAFLALRTVAGISTARRKEALILGQSMGLVLFFLLVFSAALTHYHMQL